MNKLFKFLSENEKFIKILLVFYTLYCAIVIGASWDEKYHQLVGQINLKYLLSFGLIEESLYQKWRYSTLYWSLSSLFSQLTPEKYNLESYHVINAFFGLMTIVGFYHIVKKIFNKKIAKTSSVFLFFIPFFFGHFAINNKDILITFAHVWTVYYLIKYSLNQLNLKYKITILFKIAILTALGSGIQLLFFGSLAPILIFFIFYLIMTKKKKLNEMVVDFVIYFVFFYTILILFWVDVHENILTLPFKYFIDSFSLGVGWPFNLTDEIYTSSQEVPNLYLLTNYFYKLPEFILFLYLVSLPTIIFKFDQICKNLDNFLKKIIFLTILLFFPNMILVFIAYPIYDGVRLFLWVTPYLVIIPALTFILIVEGKSLLFRVSKVILFVLFSFHIFNFIKITPYHYTFLNYLSGDVSKRYKKFENDYWSTSLKELILSSNLTDKKIYYTVCGVSPGIAKTYMKQKYDNIEYTDYKSATYAIMTNRTLYSEKNQSISNCYDEYKFENIAEVKRNGLILSAIKKMK